MQSADDADWFLVVETVEWRFLSRSSLEKLPWGSLGAPTVREGALQLALFFCSRILRRETHRKYEINK